VVIAARNTAACETAVAQLQQQHPHGHVFQTTCDVTQPDEVQHLAAFAKEKLGQIDVWVNNAGASQIPKAPLADTASQQIQQIVGTNMLGTLLGSQAAIQIMRTQATGDVLSAAYHIKMHLPCRKALTCFYDACYIVKHFEGQFCV